MSGNKIEKQRIFLFNRSNRQIIYSLIILFVIISVLYLGFHDRYIPDNPDNVWSFSWAWNLYNLSDFGDPVFGDLYNGTLLFHRTPAIIYGAFASIFGWKRGTAMILSKIFVLATAFIWYCIIRKLGYKKLTALTFMGIMMLIEAYFGIANKLRGEPLVLFLCSVSFLLFQHEKFFLSGLILGIAVESHPFAIIGGVWILAYMFVIWNKIKINPTSYCIFALRFIFGLLIGLVYWFLFHGNYIDLLDLARERLIGNVFWEYYFQRRYAWRHWPELAIILVVLTLFVYHRKYKSHPFVLPFFAIVTLFPFILSRGNLHYIVYIYPAAILLVVTVAENFRRLHLLVYSVILFQVPQYAWLFYQTRDFNQQELNTQIEQTVPPEADFIYGNPNSWFALQNRNFHAYGYFARANQPVSEWPDKFLVIATSDFYRWQVHEVMQNHSAGYRREDVAEWTYWNGKPINVFWLIRRK